MCFVRNGGRFSFDQRGFTLIELILVGAILAALTGMAIPAYNKVKDKVREVRAMTEIRGLEKAISSFYVDNGNRLPDPLTQLGSGLNFNDPWNRPYEYHVIGPDPEADALARLDFVGVNPLNTDYDLYSSGIDGHTWIDFSKTEAFDDIVRSGNGGYVGSAKALTF
jgi:general secretion pathway protein G